MGILDAQLMRKFQHSLDYMETMDYLQPQTLGNSQSCNGL